MTRERNEKGQYTETAAPETVLEVLQTTDERVLTASEVATALDVSSETARRKLTELHEQGRVERKDVGARAVVWWASTGEF